jgi:hypothetical protein
MIYFALPEAVAVLAGVGDEAADFGLMSGKVCRHESARDETAAAACVSVAIDRSPQAHAPYRPSSRHSASFTHEIRLEDVVHDRSATSNEATTAARRIRTDSSRARRVSIWSATHRASARCASDHPTVAHLIVMRVRRRRRMRTESSKSDCSLRMSTTAAMGPTVSSGFGEENATSVRSQARVQRTGGVRAH